MLYIKKKGSVGYTIVGTPTIVDGVASGFSGSDYVTTSNSIDVTKPFEIVAKITTSNSNLLQNVIIFNGTNSVIAINATSHKPVFLMRYYGTDSLLHSVSATVQSALEDNTTYYLKGICNTEGISLSVSVDKTNWNTETKAIPDDFAYWQSATTVCFGSNAGYSTSFFSGSIDLNETYITANGQPWFGVCPVEVKKHQIKGPVGYTAVGSPTIADGIVSGFTYNDYFVTAQQISTTGISSFEFYARVKTPSAFAEGWCRICNAGSFGNQGTTAGIWSNSSVTQSFFHLFGIDIYQQLLTTDTWYRIQYLYSPSSYTATVYDDNGNVLKSYTYSNPKLNLQGVIDFCQRYSNYVLGAIDLNNTYIKVNGKMWFYQPANTKYIVKDGKLVWADQNLYLLNTTNGGGYAGNSVYFNSGFVPTNKTTYEVMFDRIDSTDGSGETNCALFGINAGVYNNINYEGFRVILQNRLDCIYFGTQAIGTISNEILKNGKRKVIKSVLGSNYVVTLTQNGTTLDTFTFNTVSDQTCFGNLYLGCYNYGYSDGRTPLPFYPFLGKIYYAKFWENGVLIRHFVPVPAGLVIGNFTVPSNGMFDMVNQQFYPNQGTGEFTIGRDE